MRYYYVVKLSSLVNKVIHCYPIEYVSPLLAVVVTTIVYAIYAIFSWCRLCILRHSRRILQIPHVTLPTPREQGGGGGEERKKGGEWEGGMRLKDGTIIRVEMVGSRKATNRKGEVTLNDRGHY